MSEDNSEHEIAISPQVYSLNSFEPNDKANLERNINFTLDKIFEESDKFNNDTFIKSEIVSITGVGNLKTNQQKSYALSKGMRAKIIAKVKDAANQAANRFILEHPEAKGLSCKFSAKVYAEKNVKINYSLIFTQMLDCILNHIEKPKTQKAVLDSVKQSSGIHELNANIWNMPLKRFMKTQLRERLKNHGVQISLAGCSSMSDIRKAIDTYYAKKQAVHKLKLDLAITPKELIVNGTSHTITTRPSGAYKYRSVRLFVNGKRTWLKIDVLKELFGLAE